MIERSSCVYLSFILTNNKLKTIFPATKRARIWSETYVKINNILGLGDKRAQRRWDGVMRQTCEWNLMDLYVKRIENRNQYFFTPFDNDSREMNEASTFISFLWSLMYKSINTPNSIYSRGFRFRREMNFLHQSGFETKEKVVNYHQILLRSLPH